MGWGDWMTSTDSLESQARLAICRQQVQSLPLEHLRATADQLVVLNHNQERMLRGAMRRIAELEVQRALINAQAAAASLQRPKQSKLRALLDWFTRWRLKVW